MGWEWRGGRRYWYDAERVGGRVVKRYVGTGPLAGIAEQLRVLDAEKRKSAKIDRELAAARRSRGARAARVIAVADAVLAVWLPAVGWHRPNRGPWRRKRGCVVGGEMVTMADRRPLETWDTAALWRENGDVPAELLPPDGARPKAAAVAEYLKDHPAAVALYGDLARHAVRVLANRSGGDGTLAAAAVMARAEALRRELAGDTPNPVELLLAERVVVSWAAVHHYELTYFTGMGKSRPVREHLWQEKRMDAAHRRLLSALKTLAAVRRMKLPDLLAVVQVTGEPLDCPARAAVPEPSGG